jgi:ribonucleoside-diphosphate reductase alpha chain
MASRTRQRQRASDLPPAISEETKLEGLQRKVFLDRYALRGEDGTPLETYPEQMWLRVARGIAEVEPTAEKKAEWTDNFYHLLQDFKFVPGGRILSGAGTPHEVTYYNCYVVGLGEDPLNTEAPKKPMLDPDSAREAFYTALSQMTDIMSRSGGVGMNLSALPPSGITINATGRGQHGAVRPTVTLSVSHPDIERFIAEKDSPNLRYVDLAVIVPPEFDEAIAGDADWTPQWEDWKGETTRARDLWARVTSDQGRRLAIVRPDAPTLRVADSRDAIVDGAAQVATELFHGRVPVVDFSLLRPKGAYIKTVNGTSSGPVAWMYLFDAVARSDDGVSSVEKGVIWFGEIASVVTGKTIQQGGSRRGALMLMIDDDHPDIEAFIAAKRIDPSTGRPVMIEHANMSLCISDAFMAAVKADLPWDLRWQGKVVRTVRARDIWDQICEAAWNTAEPGVVFMQRAQEQSPMWYVENIRCTNPCVTGDTLVYTAEGLYSAAELAQAGTPVRIASASEDGIAFRQASNIFPTGVKPVLRLQTNEGYSVRLTADHRVLTTRGWVEAKDLTAGDKIRLLNGEGGFGVAGSEAMGRILGWLVGDGHITKRGNGQASVVLSFLGEDRALASAYASSVNQLVAAAAGSEQHPVGVVAVPDRDESRVRSVRLLHMIDPVLLENKLQVPPAVLRGSLEMQRGFLQALFSADGSVQGNHSKGISVRLSSSYRGLLEDVQRLLLNFGIVSTLSTERRPEMVRPMPDGDGGEKEHQPQAHHELAITCANIAVFSEKIGFLQERKQEKLAELLGSYRRSLTSEPFIATFVELTPAGEEMVYDLTEPESHLFIGNGLVLHNCGEQPIPAGAVCNLGALNLARYVDDHGQLLEAELAHDAACAVRFLDDVIDATPYFSELHVQMQREGTRRVGLGTMGLADALIKMRVAYGSAESLEVIDRIYGTIRDAAYQQGVALAEEKGPCGFFEKEKYLDGAFIRTLPEAIREGISQHGIRNGVLMTQAPTGTTSLLAGVSSGIEPVYDFAMKRTDRIGEHIIYHPLFQAWLAEHPGEDKPSYFVSVKELTPEEHVAVQARVQQYTDASISKTVNGPSENSIDDVKRLYTLAYDLGCKGVTYYRDGSRDAVLTSFTVSEKKSGKSEDNHVKADVSDAVVAAAAVDVDDQVPGARSEGVSSTVSSLPEWMLEGQLKRRPSEMAGYTLNVAAPEGKVNITINSDGDGPLEVFVNIGRAGSDVAALAEALGRLISLQLRLPSTMSQEERLRQVASQLRGIGGSRSIGFGKHRVASLPDAVAQAIYRHIEEHPLSRADESARLMDDFTSESIANGSLEINGHSGHETHLMSPMSFPTLTGNLCPQCGSAGSYVMEEGCRKCHNCGYSEC